VTGRVQPQTSAVTSFRLTAPGSGFTESNSGSCLGGKCCKVMLTAGLTSSAVSIIPSADMVQDRLKQYAEMI
jgi:hypothetical protein